MITHHTQTSVVLGEKNHVIQVTCLTTTYQRNAVIFTTSFNLVSSAVSWWTIWFSTSHSRAVWVAICCCSSGNRCGCIGDGRCRWWVRRRTADLISGGVCEAFTIARTCPHRITATPEIFTFTINQRITILTAWYRKKIRLTQISTLQSTTLGIDVHGCCHQIFRSLITNNREMAYWQPLISFIQYEP